MGPLTLAPGEGADVLPHPHIGLATVTWLLDGELVHRDSLGSHQVIRPGELDWMTAGRGIVHSERTPPEARRGGSTLHGLQIWVALPSSHEEAEPSFVHHPGEALPLVEHAGARVRLLAGCAFGVESPVRTASPLLFADARMPQGCELPVPGIVPERAAYVVNGVVGCGAERAGPGRMLVFATNAEVVLRAGSAAHVVLIGGAPLEARRHVSWNFVSSSKARIEQARQDWLRGRFPLIAGDADESVPLPAQ